MTDDYTRRYAGSTRLHPDQGGRFHEPVGPDAETVARIRALKPETEQQARVQWAPGHGPALLQTGRTSWANLPEGYPHKSKPEFQVGQRIWLDNKRPKGHNFSYVGTAEVIKRDGPLLQFRMDADGRVDSFDLDGWLEAGFISNGRKGT